MTEGIDEDSYTTCCESPITHEELAENIAEGECSVCGTRLEGGN